MRSLNDVTHDLMVCAGRATREGYTVALVAPDEWAEWYAEEHGDRTYANELVTVYTPLADLGWQNFICDDDNIIVRFEVTG
jgi:hypothetical protein